LSEVEEHGCVCNFGLGLEVVGVESLAKGRCIMNVVCDLAVIEIWGEGYKTGSAQSPAEILHCVVQPPQQA
jgi:hypothetical protein